MLYVRPTALLVALVVLASGCGDEDSVLEPAAPQAQGPSWVVLHPSPDINSLNAVCASDNGVVVAVGDRGVLLRSQDSGASWKHVPMEGAEAALTDIDMEDQFGIAIGADGRWYRTDDSGLEWADEGYLARDVWLEDVDVFDADVAAVVGSRGMVWRTDDGGETWQASANLLQGNSGYRISTRSSGSTVLLGSSGQCMWSTDGGRSWDSRPLPGEARQGEAISLIDDSSAIAMVGGDGGFSLIFVTTDEGRTWRESEALGHHWVGASLKMESRTELLVIAGQLMWRTEDGGATWERLPVIEALLYDVTATGPDELVAVGYAGMILRSSDGGTSWQEQSQGMGVGAYRPELTCVQVLDEYTAVTGSRQNPGVFRTTDGGATWKSVGPATAVNDLCFYDDLNGIATPYHYDQELGPFYRTSDGGETWTPVHGTEGNYGRVHIHGSGLGFSIVGGRVRRTIDGGVTWDAPVGDIGEHQPGFPHVVTPEVVLVVTRRGNELLRSTSSGVAEWEVISTPGSIRDIAFTEDGSVGVAVGGGQFMRTTDLGATWEVVGDYPRSLRALAFADDRTVFAAGMQGSIYVSRDAGVSWEHQMTVFGDWPGSAAPVRFLHDLDFAASGFGLVVGGGGTVLELPPEVD